MIIVGILSDTHLHTVTDQFLTQCDKAFAHCDMILHAGDLTDISILSAFKQQDVYAVSGNMCNHTTSRDLPRERRITVCGYQIGLTHGAGIRHNIEDRVFELFPDVDCIVYGHTHAPVCHYYGKTLMINPGSFQGTGRYGAACSYAILKMSKKRLTGSLHTL